LLLIALAVAWLLLAAFVLTMCRLAARSDAVGAGRGDNGTSHSRPVRQPSISRGGAPAQRRPRRSGLRVE
jgi:hypothetical protein